MEKLVFEMLKTYLESETMNQKTYHDNEISIQLADGQICNIHVNSIQRGKNEEM